MYEGACAYAKCHRLSFNIFWIISSITLHVIAHNPARSGNVKTCKFHWNISCKLHGKTSRGNFSVSPTISIYFTCCSYNFCHHKQASSVCCRNYSLNKTAMKECGECLLNNETQWTVEREWITRSNGKYLKFLKLVPSDNGDDIKLVPLCKVNTASSWDCLKEENSAFPKFVCRHRVVSRKLRHNTNSLLTFQLALLTKRFEIIIVG